MQAGFICKGGYLWHHFLIIERNEKQPNYPIEDEVDIIAHGNAMEYYGTLRTAAEDRKIMIRR